jgi:Chromo (CHRromatin Organisation MOdifier) domain
MGLFGVPKGIRTDGGSQFTALVCQELSTLLKITHLVIVPYYPQANGLIERRNAEIMKHLRVLVFARDIHDSWSKVLPLVQRILNFTKDGSINVAPAQVIFGDMIPASQAIDMTSTDGSVPVSEYLRVLKTKQLALIQATQEYLKQQSDIKDGKTDLIVELPNYDIGDYVLLSYPSRPPSKLAGLYRGPLVVTRKLRKDLYEVTDLITNKLSQVHISRMHVLVVPPDATRDDILRLAGLDHHEYVVESIIDHKGNSKRKRDMEFLIRWKGYEPSEDTWEPYATVKDLVALDEYSKLHPDLGLG